MGVEYDANYGIGYGVSATDELDDHEDMECGLGEYIDTNLSHGFYWFQEANCYSGEVYETYIVSSNPFRYGLDLTEVNKEILTEIKRLKLDIEDDSLSCVGGLLIS